MSQRASAAAHDAVNGGLVRRAHSDAGVGGELLATTSRGRGRRHRRPSLSAAYQQRPCYVLFAMLMPHLLLTFARTKTAEAAFVSALILRAVSGLEPA